MHENIENKILKALEEIRPFFKSDGGDIELVEVKGQTVKVKLQGNCAKCSLKQTSLNIVEKILKGCDPEIQKVIHVESQ